jgi:hypothetical protein
MSTSPRKSLCMVKSSIDASAIVVSWVTTTIAPPPAVAAMALFAIPQPPASLSLILDLKINANTPNVFHRPPLVRSIWCSDHWRPPASVEIEPACLVASGSEEELREPRRLSLWAEG